MKILLLCLSFFAIGLIPANGQQLLKIDDFSAHEADLEILGDANFYEDRLRLTPSRPYQMGATWFSEGKVDLVRGFETEFIFEITNPDEDHQGGDGFAFVIHNNPMEDMGGYGDSIGYKGLGGGVVIEFDTYDNDEGSRNHVTLSYYDPAEGGFKRHATVHQIPEMSDGEQHFARIEYKEGFLTFYLDSYIFPVLSSKLDVKSIIGADQAWIGFTSATSFAHADHDILKWTIGQFLPPPDLAIDVIRVEPKYSLEVKSRDLKISVWDHNQVDGDIISLKVGEQWLITEYELIRARKTVPYTFTGFNTTIILYAHNLGQIPPNTAAVAIDDGHEVQTISLESDLENSEAIEIIYTGE